MRAINLLPPESLQKQKGQRKRALLILLTVAYLGFLGLVTSVLGGRVGEIEDRRDAQIQLNSSTESEIAVLAPMDDLFGEYTVQRATLETILARDVSWGRVLNDLSRVMPDRTWLTSFNGTANVAATTPGLGSIQMNGVAFDFPDVSAWLRALDADTFPAVDGTWVSTISTALLGEIEILNYVSQTALTEAADAGRREDRIPEVNS
ncbi:MAG: PilN domain-containing protein [Acidobacteria bacterium]|nr:PilN domain-containing protein [Acidobacteriota bacterium]